MSVVSTNENENKINVEEWRDQPPYAYRTPFTALYEAKCYCGTVHYEISSLPLDGTYCHCKGCQVLHGAPLQWAVIFPKDSIRFTRGTDSLVFFNSSTLANEHELPCKVLCGRCHTPIADEGRRMWLAFPSLITLITEDTASIAQSSPLTQPSIAQPSIDNASIDNVSIAQGSCAALTRGFRPSCHIFYGHRILDVNDGLPKYEGHKGKSNLIPE